MHDATSLRESLYTIYVTHWLSAGATAAAAPALRRIVIAVAVLFRRRTLGPKHKQGRQCDSPCWSTNSAMHSLSFNRFKIQIGSSTLGQPHDFQHGQYEDVVPCPSCIASEPFQVGGRMRLEVEHRICTWLCKMWVSWHAHHHEVLLTKDQKQVEQCNVMRCDSKWNAKHLWTINEPNLHLNEPFGGRHLQIEPQLPNCWCHHDYAIMLAKGPSAIGIAPQKAPTGELLGQDSQWQTSSPDEAV